MSCAEFWLAHREDDKISSSNSSFLQEILKMIVEGENPVNSCLQVISPDSNKLNVDYFHLLTLRLFASRVETVLGTHQFSNKMYLYMRYCTIDLYPSFDSLLLHVHFIKFRPLVVPEPDSNLLASADIVSWGRFRELLAQLDFILQKLKSLSISISLFSPVPPFSE